MTMSELTLLERAYLDGWTLAANTLAITEQNKEWIARGGIAGAIHLRDFPRDAEGEAWDAGRSDAYLSAFGFE